MKPVLYVTIVLVPGRDTYCPQCRQRLPGERGLVVAKDVLDPRSGHVLVRAVWSQQQVFEKLSYEGWRFAVTFQLPDDEHIVIFERPNLWEKAE
jgi:hypothetical protein